MAQVMNGKLIVSEGGRDKIHEICEDTVVVGRGTGATLHLRDPQVSTAHCEIRRTERGFKVVDLETSAGTRVNGGVVNQHLLQNGDTIQVGDARITFLGDSAQPPAKPRRPARTLPSSLPQDENGRPRRYYRHESRASRGNPAVVLALIFGGILVVVLLILYLGGRQYRSDITVHLDRINELIEEGTETSLMTARGVLKEIPYGELGRERREDIRKRIDSELAHVRRMKKEEAAEEEYRALRQAFKEGLPVAALEKRVHSFKAEYPENPHLPEIQDMLRRARFGGAEKEARWREMEDELRKALRYGSFEKAFAILEEAASDQDLARALGERLKRKRAAAERKLKETFEDTAERLPGSEGEDREALKEILRRIAALKVEPTSGQAAAMLERID